MTGTAHPLHVASLGEVAWAGRDGRPRAAGVLPLVRREMPVVALTFDRAALAVELASAHEVVLVVREPRNTGTGFAPTGWSCRSRLVEDLDGEVYLDDLLEQELRRYPPARRYADSPILRREHWWYLPRLVVELTPVAQLDPPAPREGPDDALLVTVRESRPVVSGVRVDQPRLLPTWGEAPEAGPGTLLGQDASFPDLEVWHRWTHPVTVDERGVTPDGPLPDRGVASPPGLGQRWRAERRFAAACRRGIRAWQA